ncbi:MAG: 2,3-bisphosphoglycerate-independent phosphoglycerate mutase [Pseudanabaenaceae cyanobacterium bins.68]|nr:2,3-bisphosphoglycerate-independent phosphoglycerate mutase [Pseudanabaenaceae cyanobacterium bins.68]
MGISPNLKSVSPVVLVILDGWGYREQTDGNAIAAASTPVISSLWQTYPHTLLQASGKDVGLPRGQMGNSEVGHLNIGAGRIVPQELVRISDAVEDNSIFENLALVSVCQAVQQHQSQLHLIALCSDGGVHAHIEHLIAMVQLAKRQGIERVCIHAITDGRDTLPHSGAGYLEYLQDQIDQIGVGKIVTICGRYYAMDRDKRWDRVEKAYRVLTEDQNCQNLTAAEVLEHSYAQDLTDEFILPVRIAPGAIAAQDGVIFCNFRPDRARELTQALISQDFDGFPRDLIPNLHFASFTQYDNSLTNCAIAFPPQELKNLLGEIIAAHGLRQFRLAETEKYAHVTYFFDGGNEEPSPGQDCKLVSSPSVSTYDQAPGMAAFQVTELAIAALKQQTYALIVINYANPDMVGHTGNYQATVEAIAVVDQCLGKLIPAITELGGTALITADHGNAEYMWDEHRNPWTAHTTNAVPFILVEGEGRKIPGHGGDVKLRESGKLADIAPTILEILQLDQPAEMTGQSLIVKAEYEVTHLRQPALRV